MGHKRRMKLRQDFHFDAAHWLNNYADDHQNRRLHGHSFRVRVTLDGKPDRDSQQILDFESFNAAIAKVRATLDHHLLNEIDGLEKPTLETLTKWIWDQLSQDLPQISEVEIFRDSLGQSCSYQGE